MYNNPYYLNTYSSQSNLDRINNQMAELERMKQQIQQSMQQPQPQQPTNLTQNFQLAPNSNVMKYANNIEEVQREVVAGDTPYFSKDMSVVWIKTIKGDIKTYELDELIPQDSKDMQIEYLQSQIEELRKEMRRNDAGYSNVASKQNATNTSEYDETNGERTQKSKSTSVSKVSRSKEE